MFRVRRQRHEPRIELAPLIDVMLFLLTFLIYAVTVNPRVELMPMELRAFRSGQAAKPAAAASISIGLNGKLFLDRAPVGLDEVADKLEALRTASPDLVVYIALADGQGEVDRSGLMLDVWDRLQPGKFKVNMVGRRRTGPETVGAPAASAGSKPPAGEASPGGATPSAAAATPSAAAATPPPVAPTGADLPSKPGA